jgi:hypothetical protein
MSALLSLIDRLRSEMLHRVGLSDVLAPRGSRLTRLSRQWSRGAGSSQPERCPFHGEEAGICGADWPRGG